MGRLDFLIDKDKHLEPDYYKEYLYRHVMYWKTKELKSYNTKENRIVINVVKRPEGGFEFSFLDDIMRERYWCNYGWAFAENTTENVEKIKEFEKMYKKYKKFEKELNLFGETIVTLQTKK